MARLAKVLEITLNLEMGLHRKVCADFGLSSEDLEATQPAPVTLGYSSWMLRIAHQGDAGDIMAALLPCAWGYGEIGQRLAAQGLPEAKHCREWIETYASEEYQELVRWMREWFDAHATRASEADRTRWQGIVDVAGRWEHLFWEMAWHRQTWPV